MKYSIAWKFIAVLLCALTLLIALGCGVALVGLGGTGILSGKTAQQLQQERAEHQMRWYGEEMASIWASETFGEMPEEISALHRRNITDTFFPDGGVSCTIYNADGDEVYTIGEVFEDAFELRFQLDSVNYPHYVRSEDTESPENNPEAENREISALYPRESTLSGSYACYYEETGKISVGVTLAENALPDADQWELMELLGQNQKLLFAGLVLSLLLFSISAVYLCAAAGHKPGTDAIRASGLNALPLDFYLGCVLGIWVLIVLLLENLFTWVYAQGWQLMLCCLGSLGFVACLPFVGICFAFAAQVKMEHGYWFWNTICGRCLKLGFRCIRWLLPRTVHLISVCFRLCLRLVKDCWKIALSILTFGLGILRTLQHQISTLLRRTLRRAEHFFSLLPLTWQWFLSGGALLGWLVIALAARFEGMFVLGCIAGVLLIAYGSNSFGLLLSAVKRMRGGDLKSKVDDRLMVGAFREFSEELNGLADVAMVAAQKQLKSERMKTELITNVSHDIKTPLTSIINYVDLLEKPHTPEQEKTYLEVLHRQSQRMKKLIEDLMEMSKASTGNIPVELAKIDAAEAVNQAMGEFSDKLTAAGLTPMIRLPEEPTYLLADGRLLWRAMSNILSNAVKYALPGTRFYVDVTSAEDKAMISFKNISGTELNISADELMERFVRGDSSRNTEGSGLGLNIAKSLMELQKGQLQLLVDGDLFKVTLVFPKA